MSPPPIGVSLPVPAQPVGRSAGAVSVYATAARLWPGFKRVTDVLLAAVLLMALLPILLVVVIAIKLDSRGPVLYRAPRVGYRGRPLMMLKFRKMHENATGGPLTTGRDPRLTRVGTVLTRTRLDELPQLWDVLRGRMSLIGPRPEDPRFVALHPERYDRILSVRPGITGITQLAYAEESRLLDPMDPVPDYVARLLPQKVALDCLYVERYRPRLDFAVLRWTVASVLLRRQVAVDRSTARLTARRREPQVVTATALPDPGSVAAFASTT